MPAVPACRRARPSGSAVLIKASPGLLAALMLLVPALPLHAQKAAEEIQDITGNYHFLSPDDKLGILEEEGRLKGYLDVYQGEEESDEVLSYTLQHGSRQKGHVEFKTSKIHEKYYRFSGAAERGSGRRLGDPDYIRLVGDLEIVTVNADTGAEQVERRHVVLKSMGKGEEPDEDGN